MILACSCRFVTMNFDCKVLALQFYPFTINMYLCHITLIYYLLLISTLFISLQVADEIQVLQRQGSRKLRKITFELNKHINPARDAARKERYKKIAQKYQQTVSLKWSAFLHELIGMYYISTSTQHNIMILIIILLGSLIQR